MRKAGEAGKGSEAFCEGVCVCGGGRVEKGGRAQVVGRECKKHMPYVGEDRSRYAGVEVVGSVCSVREENGIHAMLRKFKKGHSSRQIFIFSHCQEEVACMLLEVQWINVKKSNRQIPNPPPSTPSTTAFSFLSDFRKKECEKEKKDRCAGTPRMQACMQAAVALIFKPGGMGKPRIRPSPGSPTTSTPLSRGRRVRVMIRVSE